MKNILITTTFLFFSVATLAKETIEHQCFPENPQSEISKVLIVYSTSDLGHKEYLEVYGQDLTLTHRWEVQYSDDMTYVGYANVEENIYFDRDWPVQDNRGSGRLQIGPWGDSNGKPKIYDLDCFSPEGTQD